KKICRAKTARGALLYFKSRISDEMPEIPSNPDFLFRTLIISSIDIPVLCIKCCNSDGSISPERVPIVIPDKGLNPIEVSNDLPFLTAVIEEPEPKWQIIIFNSLGSLC